MKLLSSVKYQTWSVHKSIIVLLSCISLAIAGCGTETTDESGQPETDTNSADGTSDPLADAANAAPEEVLEIAFVGESSSTDVIWQFAADIMRQEAESHNANFVDRYADGDFARQAQMIEEEVARGVDGIIAPFFDPETSNAAIRQALEAGISVFAIMGVPDLEDSEIDQIGYAETSWYDVGAQLGEIALAQLGDNSSVVWPAEQPEGTYITDAVQGFEDAAENMGVTTTVEVLDAGSDPSQNASRQLTYLTANPDTDAVVTSGAIAIGAANTAMQQGSLPAGEPPLFGQVVNPSSIRGIKDGYMPAGVWIATEEASVLGIQNLVEMIRDDADPHHGTVPITVVTTENVDDVVPEELAQ